MKVQISGSDPIFIGAAIYGAYDQSVWWLLVIPLVIASWFFDPRWDKENGWRLMR